MTNKFSQATNNSYQDVFDSYEAGFEDGYETFLKGYTPEFREVYLNGVTVVSDQLGQQVAERELSYALGHVKGWEQAAEDSFS